MTQELKCCPFCGGVAARTIHIRDGRKVACLCGACGKLEFHGRLDQPSAEERAITAWNTRAPASPVEAAADDLLAALVGAMGILGTAESNASGNPEWDYVAPRIEAARAAITKATGQQVTA